MKLLSFLPFFLIFSSNALGFVIPRDDEVDNSIPDGFTPNGKIGYIINNPLNPNANCGAFIANLAREDLPAQPTSMQKTPNPADHCVTVPKEQAEASIKANPQIAASIEVEIICFTGDRSPLWDHLWYNRVMLNKFGRGVCHAPGYWRCASQMTYRTAQTDFCREANLPKEKKGDGHPCETIGWIIGELVNFCYLIFNYPAKPERRAGGSAVIRTGAKGRVNVYNNCGDKYC